MSQTILNELLEGNKRFASESNEFPRIDKKRRHEGLNGQNPKAIIIGCADSRIPPELLFDQGLGDLFVIRVAGNIIDDAIIGSVEYAVAHLETPLIMVLSHTYCGAVDAAIKHTSNQVPGKIGSLIDAIKPAVERASLLEGDLLDNAAKENAKLVVENLNIQGEIISDAIKNNKLKALAAYYDINTGLVEIL